MQDRALLVVIHALGRPILVGGRARHRGLRRSDRMGAVNAARASRSRGAAVVGALGEVLITLGVVLGLFVVWQLWWTDVAAAQTHSQVVDDLGWETGPPPPTAEQAPPSPLPEPEHGTTFATLSVPRWGADHVTPISQGVTRDVIDVLGVGHYPGTAMPGEVGNFALAAHRVTYGKPFHRAEEIELGDELVVRTEDAWYVYRVTSTDVVLPRQTEVIAPVPGQPGVEPDRATITLTTCHPMWSARERYIVHGELERWVGVDGADDGDAAPGPTTDEGA